MRLPDVVNRREMYIFLTLCSNKLKHGSIEIAKY